MRIPRRDEDRLMDAQLKQRVIGAAVLVAIGVVFIPLFLDETSENMEPVPPFEADIAPPSDFNSRVVPLNDAEVDELERAMDSTPEQMTQAEDWEEESLPTPTPEPGEADEAVPVEASAPVTAPRTGVTAWVVQVGSFSSEANANGLLEKINKAGYTGFIEPLRDGDKVTYRVRVGPELDKLSADQIRDKLAKEVELKGIVMRYP